MFNKWIRYFHQNRKAVLILILIIVFAIAIIQLLNQYSEQQNKDKLNQIANKGTQTDKTIPSMDGETIPTEVAKKNENVIKEFIKECNNKNIENAYKLLSEKCKEYLYPTIEDFKDKYYNPIFKEQKQYIIENWLTSSNYGVTYKVKYTNDLLAYGGTKEGSVIEDYYTIDTKGNLNIGRYVGEKTINRQASNEIVNAKLNKREVYIDYQIYELTIKNNSDKEVNLYDSVVEAKLYLVDTNGMQYMAKTEELSKEDFIIRPKETKTIKIKYDKIYNLTREIEQINFENVVVGAESFNIKISF